MPIISNSNQNNLISNSQTSKQIDYAKNSSSTHAQAGPNLVKGQIVKGEVINLQNDKVTLLLENQETINATLKDLIGLSIGDKADFNVLEANNANIALKFLEVDRLEALNDMIDKALFAANLPDTKKNAAIVTKLINAQMGIDKTSIQTLVKAGNAFKQASLDTLINLQKLGLPLNEENIMNMEKYLNYENRLLPNINNQIDDIMNLFANGNLQSEELSNLNDTILGLVSTSEDIANKDILNASLEDNNLEAQNNALINKSAENLTNQGSDSLDLVNDSSSNNLASLVLKASVSNENLNDFLDNLRTLLSDKLDSNDFSNISSRINNINTETSINDFTKLMSDLTKLQDNPNTIKDGQVQDINPNITKELLAFLSKNETYTSIISTLLKERYSLSPKDLLSDNQKPEQLLNQIESELGLLKGFEQLAKDNANSQQPNNMQQNFSFIEALNQAFPYIQLPIKLSGSTIHSELFVYSRKGKQGYKPGDEVSVLLHLDMDALGPLDVRIELINKQITTKFYVSDTLSESLITENLPMLDKALLDKGYIFKGEVNSQIKNKNPLEEFLFENNLGDEVKRYSFDIRA